MLMSQTLILSGVLLGLSFLWYKVHSKPSKPLSSTQLTIQRAENAKGLIHAIAKLFQESEGTKGFVNISTISDSPTCTISLCDRYSSLQAEQASLAEFHSIVSQTPELASLTSVTSLSRSELQQRLLQVVRLSSEAIDHLASLPTVEEQDKFFRESIPFESTEDLFLFESKIHRLDKCRTSGQLIRGELERIWGIWNHYEQQRNCQDQLKQEFRDLEFLTSRMADREPPVGTVVRCADGYYQYRKNFVKNGAFVSLLVHLSDPSRVILACRGTRMTYTATGGYLSGLNDVLVEMGSWAIRSVILDILHTIQDMKISYLHVMGKSLGGAIAQHLALLILSLSDVIVNRLSTSCSVGISIAENQRFIQLVTERKLELPVVHVRNSGDMVPVVGGVLFGERELSNISFPVDWVQMYYVHNPNDPDVTVDLAQPFPRLNVFGGRLIGLFLSLASSHTRQTTMFDFDVISPNQLEQELSQGVNRLESARKFLAFTLKYLGLYFINVSVLGVIKELDKPVTQ